MSFETREDAAEGVETAKAQALEAELIDFDTAAFQLYETDGEWRWRLLGEDGNELAASRRGYPSHREAREAMNTVKEFGSDAVVQVAE